MDNKLTEAAQGNDINALYELIQLRPQILEDVDMLPFFNTPLHVAASLGHVDFAMEMMNLKPSFARKLNQAGFSPLHLALQNTENSRHQMVRVLVNADKDLVRVKGREGMTPLHQVATPLHQEATPLHQAANLELLAEFLRACPRSIKEVNIRGETALHVAAKGNMVKALQILVNWLRRNHHKYGDVWEDEILNSEDNDGNTVLHLASRNNNPEMIRQLINGKVNKNKTNLANFTALDILLEGAGTEEAQRILRRAGGLRGTAIPSRRTLAEFLQSEISVWEMMYKSLVRKRKNLLNETRNAMLVVAGLILTATYQATLSPPGGISQGPASNSLITSSGGNTNYSTNNDTLKGLTVDGHHLGKSVMASDSFLLFYVLNTFSFFLAFMVTLFSLISVPPFVMALLLLPLGFLFLCFVYATIVISPTVGYVIFFVVFFYVFIPIIICVLFRLSHYEKHLKEKYK